jgi:hypothetical protein
MFQRKTFALGLASCLLLPTHTASAADHLDAPNLAGLGSRDVNDLYAFVSPTNPDHTVLIMTVNPFAGQLSGTTFGTDVLYEFLIDNDGDAIADVSYGTTFAVEAGGSQVLTTARGGSAPDASYATGSTGADIATSGGGTLRAGLFDDPFFFDLVGFRNGFSFTGDDAFAGANVSAIVLEVPSSELGTDVGIWARTSVGGNQVDRMGRPAINTALIPSSPAGRKQAFNEGAPADDPATFSAEVQATIEALNGGDAAHASSVTGVLLPDVLTFNTSNSGGFLNGRRLEDDVIDAELDLLSKGAVTSDGVNGNDVAFPGVFPHLAPANVIPEPATLALLGIGMASLCRRGRTRRNLICS